MEMSPCSASQRRMSWFEALTKTYLPAIEASVRCVLNETKYMVKLWKEEEEEKRKWMIMSSSPRTTTYLYQLFCLFNPLYVCRWSRNNAKKSSRAIRTTWACITLLLFLITSALELFRNIDYYPRVYSSWPSTDFFNAFEDRGWSFCIGQWVSNANIDAAVLGH